ncbi:MAG TPA: acyl-CoA dehydrogenase family protein [Candidatus Nanopelagicales bacterium]
MGRWDTPERRTLRATVRAFSERELVPNLAEWEEAGLIPLEVHRGLAEAGLLGIGFAEEVGGCGGSAVDAFIVAEEVILAGGSSGLVAALFTHGIGLPHIVAAGDPTLIDDVVRPVLAGEAIVALAVTEPEGGSDVAGLRTRAVPEGDHFRVTGSKLFITSAARANVVTTAVRTGGEGARGISLLAIDTALPGVTVSAPLAKMGWRCSDTAEIRFDDVLVPASRLVGAEGSGFAQIAQQFVAERLSIAVSAYATAQRCLDLTLAWTRQRETFGRPLSSRQVVAHRLAEMAREVDVARTYTRSVCDDWEDGADVLMRVAMAKNTAVAACDRVVDDAVQLHGGMGYMRECEVERHYRDSRILGIGGGTTEIMTEIVARLLLASA